MYASKKSNRLYLGIFKAIGVYETMLHAEVLHHDHGLCMHPQRLVSNEEMRVVIRSARHTFLDAGKILVEQDQCA
jgi:hypothetical protein